MKKAILFAFTLLGGLAAFAQTGNEQVFVVKKGDEVKLIPNLDTLSGGVTYVFLLTGIDSIWVKELKLGPQAVPFIRAKNTKGIMLTVRFNTPFTAQLPLTLTQRGQTKPTIIKVFTTLPDQLFQNQQVPRGVRLATVVQTPMLTVSGVRIDPVDNQRVDVFAKAEMIVLTDSNLYNPIRFGTIVRKDLSYRISITSADETRAYTVAKTYFTTDLKKQMALLKKGDTIKIDRLEYLITDSKGSNTIVPYDLSYQVTLF